jgi:hypothetical protein
LIRSIFATVSMKSYFLIFFLATVGAALGGNSDRNWTDEKGRNVKAALVKVDGDAVTLRLPDGREVSYPIAKLSQSDQDFIKEYNSEESTDEKAEGSEKDNFDSPWPDRVTFQGDPEIAIIKEDADEKKFVYESANYRYVCDVRLSKSVVKGFAVLFEATHQYVRELPLALNGGEKKDGKYLILLFEFEEAYISEGGPPNSAGVFKPGSNIVMVPLTSLGVRKVGSGYMLDRDKSSKTLPHELVHQLTPDRYYAPGSLGWFSEGIAEYVAVTPYRSGSFAVKTNSKPIVEYVTAYGKKNDGGRSTGTDIELGSLKTFMLQSYGSFLSDAQLNYGCALLITNYFCHMDREGDAARLKAFLKAMKEGKKEEEALAVLRDGQSWEELEKEIAKAYSRKGVDFNF